MVVVVIVAEFGAAVRARRIGSVHSDLIAVSAHPYALSTHLPRIKFDSVSPGELMGRVQWAVTLGVATYFLHPVQ